jgi:hypothetical protein
VQGQLRKEYVSIEAETRCKQSGQVMHLRIDSDMQVSVRELDAKPLVFLPDLDWENFAEKTIIDSY